MKGTEQMATMTDELRRLLDEAGVEWDYGITGAASTMFNANGVELTFIGMRDGVTCSTILTPEQAVEVTLGRGECQRRPHIDLTIGDNFLKQSGWNCSECGCRLDLPVIARYCPNCGRKVVNNGLD